MEQYHLNTEDFVKEINELRLSSGKEWYGFRGIVNGKSVVLKGYGTWLQTLKVNGTQHGNVADRKVSEFKEDLTEAVKRQPLMWSALHD